MYAVLYWQLQHMMQVLYQHNIATMAIASALFAPLGKLEVYFSVNPPSLSRLGEV
jgi:hypothetical protein